MLGCIVYEMLAGLPPFYIKDREKLFKAILNLEPEYPSALSSECLDLIENLLIKDPKLRLGSGMYGLQEVKDHPWFKSIDWDALEKKEIKPPFKPKLVSKTDTKYIDKEFTSLKAEDSAREASLLNSQSKGLWKGFTYEETKI